MNLYEISKELESLVDQETGEILEFEQFDQLSMQRDEKLENIACWIKNLRAEETALKAEEKSLGERRKRTSAKADSLEKYLDTFLGGQAFKTAKVACTYRKSKQTQVDELFVEWAKEHAATLLKFKEPEPDKTAIKNAISDGVAIEHAEIVEVSSLQIK